MKVFIGICRINNKKSGTDNDLYRSASDSDEGKFLQILLIKGGCEVVFVSEYKLDKEVNGVSIGSGKSRVIVGWKKTRLLKYCKVDGSTRGYIFCELHEKDVWFALNILKRIIFLI